MRLHDYLRRIGVTGSFQPTAETLRRLHVAHRETFLFENLTIQAGGAISLALDDLERKFIDERRGGYCFEHNTLFAAALREIGFAPIVLLGRVRRGPPALWARTHMVLAVPVVESTHSDRDAAQALSVTPPAIWLADVGFGATSLVEPIPMRDGATATQRGLMYRLRKDDRLWVLAMEDAAGTTTDLYELSEDPQTAGDVQVANHYTATHPASMFRRTITIQRLVGNDHLTLRNETLTRYRDGRLSDQPIAREQLPHVARELFGIEWPTGPLVYESYAVVA